MKMPSTTERTPRILFVGEFPPSNHHGGAILLKRLLDQHPPDCLTVIASRRGINLSQPTGLLACKHIVVPGFDRIGYLRWISKSLELALVTIRSAVEARPKRAETLMSIVQGRYYLAAALAAWITRTPHVTIVHDNFLSQYIGPSGLFRSVKRYMTNKVLQNAARVYAVSPEMQSLVRKKCGVLPQLQLPSTTAPPHHADGPADFHKDQTLVILFAGLIGYTVKDGLDLLAALIKSGELKQPPIHKIQLHLYTNITAAEVNAVGWDHEDIVCHGWLPQSRLASALASADVLFLPYSFHDNARPAVETAFPSKTADYLAAGRPFLVFGPRYSTLVRYAAEQGFAEIVDEFSKSALARGIRNLACSAEYRSQLAAKAGEAFATNHNIEHQRCEFYQTLREMIDAQSDRD